MSITQLETANLEYYICHLIRGQDLFLGNNEQEQGQGNLCQSPVFQSIGPLGRRKKLC